MVTGNFYIAMHLDGGDRNLKGESGRHAGYTVCASVPGIKNNFNYFFIPEYGLRVLMMVNLNINTI